MSAQVEIVLNMLRPVLDMLSISEKSELLVELTKILGSSNKNLSTSGQIQSNALDNIYFGDGTNSFNFAPIQNQDGNIKASSSSNQSVTHNLELSQIIEAIDQLKSAVIQNQDINPLVKDGAKDKIEKIEAEVKKPDPNKSFIQNTIKTLKQGLEGVLSLTEPTAKLASLLSKAWKFPLS
jgi:hypothetical protein